MNSLLEFPWGINQIIKEYHDYKPPYFKELKMKTFRLINLIDRYNSITQYKIDYARKEIRRKYKTKCRRNISDALILSNISFLKSKGIIDYYMYDYIDEYTYSYNKELYWTLKPVND